MRISRLTLAALTAGVALTMLGLPEAVAQEEQCVGTPPKGGKWVASGELYLNRARNPRSAGDRRKRFQEAIDILTEGYEKQPTNPKNYLLAGQAYIGLLDFRMADSAWDGALDLWSCYAAELDSLRYAAWIDAFNLGVRYSGQNDIEKAKEYYELAFVVYDGLPQSQIQLAGFYAQEAQEAQAAGDLEKAAEARRKAIDLYAGAVPSLQSERLNDATRAQYSRAAYFNLAQFLAQDERYEAAAQAYEDFLEMEPGEPVAMANAAVVLTHAADQALDAAYELDDSEEKAALEEKGNALKARATTYYEELLSRDDLTADDYHDVGAGLKTIQDQERAAKAFTIALDLQPYRFDSLQQLAFVLYSSGQYDSLVVVAKTLNDRYPNNMNNMALLANAYRELEQSENALEILQMRDDLKIEVMRLDMQQEEGVVIISGTLHNLGLPEGTPVALQFELKDEAGETVGTIDETFEAPAEEGTSRISVQAVAEVPLSGFIFHLSLPGADATGTR